MKKFLILIIGLVLGVILYVLAHTFDIDLFEILIEKIYEMESIELDELILSILVVILFASINILLIAYNNKNQKEKYQIYQAMLHSSHHILNNFLNKALIVKFEAENAVGFDKNVLKIYDDIVDEATSLIKSLESVDSIDEDTIKDSVRP